MCTSIIKEDKFNVNSAKKWDANDSLYIRFKSLMYVQICAYMLL